MSEAHPIDLNYGHLGEPIYDSNSQTWRFTRQPRIARQLRLLGQPILALEGSLIPILRRIQGASERSQNLSKLTHVYPEIFPSTDILLGLAQTSEVVNEVTSKHDPTVSELLAFGRAIVREKRRRAAQTVPIIAVAGGAAGGAVRLVLLNKEELGWEESKNAKLTSFTANRGEEGYWVGNGSPIQQLVFADMEDEAKPWLAVRYGGAISILQPLLHAEIYFREPSRPNMLPYTPSRLDPNHIVTLQVQRSGGFPIADVTFNPWNNRQIATIDQRGHWAIWNVDVQTHKTGAWTINESIKGTVSETSAQGQGEPKIVGDGWGAILWSSDMNTIVVSNRTMLAVYDVTNDPLKLAVPCDFVNMATDWILDLKRSPSDPDLVFVLTTSSIFCLHVSNPRNEDESIKSIESGARRLLSWRHFRDPQDISLRMNITQGRGNVTHGKDTATILVLLYTRLSGLTTVYTLEHSTKYSTHIISVSDPYIVKLPDEKHSQLETGASEPRPRARISAMMLRAIPYDDTEQPILAKLSRMYSDKSIDFHQLSILSNDLGLSESICVEVKTAYNITIHPPELRRRKGLKTPANISDEFIVSDSAVYHGLQDNEDSNESAGIHQLAEPSEPEPLSELEGVDKDPWTISFEWLDKDIREVLSDPIRIKHFDEVLELLYAEIEKIQASGDSKVESLSQLANTMISVIDIDKASTHLVDFFQDVTTMTTDDENTPNAQKAALASISSFLTLAILQTLGLEGQERLDEIYDGLIKAWIAPLSLEIPGRTRIALERSLRDLAAHICLAGQAVRVAPEVQADEIPRGGKDTNANRQFALPVRRKVSAGNLRKGKQPEARSSSSLASSQVSEDVGFMPPLQPPNLPTPAPTPSVHSQSSISSLAAPEDSASRRLQAYCSVAVQPSLPTKLSNLLSQWELAGDPATYDWQAAQQAFVDEESENESQAKKRQRTEKRRKRQRQDTAGSSSQPLPKMLGGSQQQAQETQVSSQPTESLLTASQPEPGRFGGAFSKHKKKKFGSQIKRPGFR